MNFFRGSRQALVYFVWLHCRTVLFVCITVLAVTTNAMTSYFGTSMSSNHLSNILILEIAVSFVFNIITRFFFLYICLEQETTPLAGSSAGAIVCAVIASGSSMQDALQATKILAEDCRTNGTAFRLGVYTLPKLMH